jgi:tRNA pseudouridine55 synthase
MDSNSQVNRLDFEQGALLLVDKPVGWTSFDIVNKLRYALKSKLGIKKIKVGHSGTLDPLATGLLIICTGKATKKINDLMGLDKTYSGEITLGASTPSYDKETTPDEKFDTSHLTESMVLGAIMELKGDLMQVPPMYSAIKIDGQPLYKKARKGKTVDIPARPVTIHDFEITAFELPLLKFEVHCSKGTYIRSLAHDLGGKLQNGGYLSDLRRIAIGTYHIDQARTLEEWLSIIANNDA